MTDATAIDRRYDSGRVSDSTLLIGTAVLITAWHFYLAAAVGLSNDEAYYRLWSLYPALSYFDHPPISAWFITAGRWLVGDTALGIRLLSPLVYLTAGVALFRTAEIFYDRSTAFLTAWLALAMPLLTSAA